MLRSAIIVLACLAFSGCLAIDKTLGRKIDLKDKQVASLTLATMEGDALCPGQEIPLIATATLVGGQKLVSEGLGAGKVLWSSFTAEAPGALLSFQGSLSLEDDIANPWEPVHVVLHVGTKGPTAVLDVPLRYDCPYSVSYGGSGGDNGDSGLDDSNGGWGGTGQNGGDGGNGQHVQVFVSLVKGPTAGRSLLKVSAQGARSHHFYYVDPVLGSFGLRANGGEGGDGGSGGMSLGGDADPGSRNGAQGDGGNGGNGGSFVVHVSPEAMPAFTRCIHFENLGGLGGKGSTPGRNGQPGPPVRILR